MTEGGLGEEGPICPELERKGIAVCALSQVMGKGFGDHKYGDYIMSCAGRQDSSFQESGGIMNPAIARALTESGKKIDHMSTRLMTRRFSLGRHEFTLLRHMRV